jgi:hypothetical protein
LNVAASPKDKHIRGTVQMLELTRQVMNSALHKHPNSPYIAAFIVFFAVLCIQQVIGMRTSKLTEFCELFAFSISIVFIIMCLLFAVMVEPSAIPLYPFAYPFEFLLAVAGLVQIFAFCNSITRKSSFVMALVVIFIGLLRIVYIYAVYINSEN